MRVSRTLLLMLSMGLWTPLTPVHAHPKSTLEGALQDEEDQDGGGIQLPDLGPEPLVASDGKLAEPGRVPTDTTAEALAGWRLLLGSTRTKGQEAAPIQSFSMGFDLRIRERGEVGFPQKQVTATFDYSNQAGGYVRGTYDSTGRTMMRGPAGDWAVDSEGAKELAGREDQTSRDELDRLLAICRNFVALTRPEDVRLVELRALELRKPNPDASHPLDLRTLEFNGGQFLRLPNHELLERARKLRWIEVASPDFRLYVPPAEAQSDGSEPVYRALLGLAEDGHAEYAQFSQDQHGAIVLSTALFVNIKQHVETSGYRLPLELEVHSVLHDGQTWRFEQHPSFELWGRKSQRRINPVFDKDHFKPAAR